MSDPTTTGLRICNTISEEGLEFIKKHSPELYEQIMKRRKKMKKETKQETLEWHLNKS